MKEYKLKKRIKINYKPSLENSVPSKFIEDVFLKNSRAKNFFDARNEWVIITVIDDTCDEFSDRCELCNTPNLKYNFVMYNTETGKTLKVGSTCIIRFAAVRGIVDVESGVTLLQNKADEAYLLNEIQTATNSVMVLHPDSRDLNKFVQNLKKIMEIKGIKNPTIQQLGEIMFGSSWSKINDPFKINRVQVLWEKPGTIETIRRKQVRYKDNPKENTTWYKKRRPVINTSLANSEIYNVENYVQKKK